MARRFPPGPFGLGRAWPPGHSKTASSTTPLPSGSSIGFKHLVQAPLRRHRGLDETLSAIGRRAPSLAAIAQQRLLLASGFAEGESGRGILRPGMPAKRVSHGVLANGSKKPCSLSRPMNLLTPIVLIPATSAGIERRPFWNSNVLAGAESDEIVLATLSFRTAWFSTPPKTSRPI